MNFLQEYVQHELGWHSRDVKKLIKHYRVATELESVLDMQILSKFKPMSSPDFQQPTKFA